MKQGWEYKKLGEVCQVLDSQRRPITKKDRTKGIYPYYGASGIQDHIDSYIFDGRFLLVGEDGAKWGASDKSAYIIDGKSWVNNHAHILKVSDAVNDRLIEYYLTFKDLSEYITGAVVPKLTQKALVSIPIPVPPLSEQQRIVEELDLLGSIIEKKKAQLAELDKLAQSLFYEMFGDPITNEKGWEVKKLEEIANSKIGITYKPTDVNDNGIVVLRSSNIQNSEIDLKDVVRVNCNLKEEKYVRQGDILMCTRNGSFKLVGKVAMIGNLSEKMTYGAFMTIIRSSHNEFLLEFFKLPAFRQQLGSAKTATINQITVKMLNSVKVIVPPFELQQLFADKIQAIERQKELIKQSIAEVETLFNSRMDYYFN